MSSLGLSLLILIVVVVGGLAAFNFWTQRRNTPVSSSEDHGFSSGVPDRTEPSLEPSEVVNAARANASATADMPAWALDDSERSQEARAAVPADEPMGAAVASAEPESMDAWLNKARQDLSGSGATESGSADPADEVGIAEPEGHPEAHPEAAPANAAPLSDQEIDARLDFDADEGVATVEPSAGAPVSNPEADTESADASDDTHAAEAEIALALPERAEGEQAANNFFTTVNLDVPGGVDGETLLRVTEGLSKVGTKPVWISAGDRINESSVRTSMIEPGSVYTVLRFDLLQVNRQGPLSGVEYSDFVRRVNDIAEELDVMANTPDMNVVLLRSRVLDDEVASLDAQVAINVEAEEPIAISRFNECANEFGLHSRGDKGGYVRHHTSGAVLHSVDFDVQAGRIVMVLDVPTVASEFQPIRQMVECAWKFAQALNGQMIDDSGRTINNALFERIESQIATHYQVLESAGLPAGAELTKLIYNVESDLPRPESDH